MEKRLINPRNTSFSCCLGTLDTCYKLLVKVVVFYSISYNSHWDSDLKSGKHEMNGRRFLYMSPAPRPAPPRRAARNYFSAVLHALQKLHVQCVSPLFPCPVWPPHSLSNRLQSELKQQHSRATS
jgi:hypothetical protein